MKENPPVTSWAQAELPNDWRKYATLAPVPG